MIKASILQGELYQDNKPKVQLILESDFTKEIRIGFRQGQVMKEHKTPYPIVVEIVEGCIDFGVQGQQQILQKGDIIALAGGVPHDLSASKKSIVRLTLSKYDASERVKNVADK